MSRYSASDVVDILNAFDNDYDDGLEGYSGVSSVEYFDNGDAVVEFTITPVLQDESGDGEYRVTPEQAERFRVKIIRL
jgi:hypothetical protein